jgi:hypothetical protein
MLEEHIVPRAEDGGSIFLQNGGTYPPSPYGLTTQKTNTDMSIYLRELGEVGKGRVTNSPLKLESVNKKRSKMTVFWVVAPCSLVEVYQRFRGPCCQYHQLP